MNWLPSDRYWFWWFVLAVTAFLFPEIRSLVTGHPENTLSAAIWRLEGYHSNGWGWNAFRFLFAGVLLLMDVWLFCHFIFRKFT